MSNALRPSPIVLALSLVLCPGLLGCDEAKQTEPEGPSASLQAKTTITAESFDLATVVELVEREDVRDAESLEALINAEDSTIIVDIDGDGQRDFIQVHEVGPARAIVVGADADADVDPDPVDGALTVAGKDGQTVTFELRVVPSSKVEVEVEAEVTTVVVATVEVELHEVQREVVITASYAPTVVVVSDVHVEHRYVHRVELEHRHDHLVVVGAPFIAWVWIGSRPIYVGHVHLPPGHAKKLGLSWHHGGRGPHHKGGPGHHTHVKVKSGGGGPDKVHVKSKGGPGGGGKVQVKTKGGGGGGKGKR
jgi:hypothetical protein